MTDPAASSSPPGTPPSTPPSTTPGAMLLRALPRLVVAAVLVLVAVTRSGWVQIFAVIVLLFTALSAADWARWVRTGVQPGSGPARIPDRFRGGELEVWLEDAGPTKIQTVKLVRELKGLGITAAKELVENLPARLAEGLTDDGAAWVSKPFTTHGARTSVRPAGATEPAQDSSGNA